MIRRYMYRRSFENTVYNAQRRRLTSSNQNEKFFDVTIVGGGVVGSSLANLISMKLPDLKVALIDSKKDPPAKVNIDRVPSPRSYALSPRSLETLGESIRSRLPIGYYDSMQVWRDSSPASLTFTSADLDPDPAMDRYLGGCCEDHVLVAELYSDIQKSTEIMYDTKLGSLDMGDSTTPATIKTTSGLSFQTALLVGADGGNSWIRNAAGISRIGAGYEQEALTFTVSIEKGSSMNGRAFQRYLADGGPIALLPTFSPTHAVVVWSTSPETVAKWRDVPDQDLVKHLNDSLLEGPQRIPPMMESTASQHHSSESSVLSNLVYGAERVLDTVHYGMAMASQQPKPTFRVPPKIATIASQKFNFPLSCYNATTFVNGRVALVGDAAHIVHPMAGQGLNLGMADVDTLFSCIEKAYDSGMDLSSFLHEYNSSRHKNVSISLGGIHALQRLFQNKNSLLQHAMTFGLNVIQNVGSLRRQLAVAAARGVDM